MQSLLPAIPVSVDMKHACPLTGTVLQAIPFLEEEICIPNSAQPNASRMGRQHSAPFTHGNVDAQALPFGNRPQDPSAHEPQPLSRFASRKRKADDSISIGEGADEEEPSSKRQLRFREPLSDSQRTASAAAAMGIPAQTTDEAMDSDDLAELIEEHEIVASLLKLRQQAMQPNL